LPIGKSGVDAFGQKPRFIDEGDRLRGIANIGREDVIVEGLTPLNPGVRVLGASSDHLVLDLTEAVPALAVGSRVSFRMNYGAMLAAMTSEYIEKHPINAAAEEPKMRRVAIQLHDDPAAEAAPEKIGESLVQLGYELTSIESPHEIRISLGTGRAAAWEALSQMTEVDTAGLIWIDAIASFHPWQTGVQIADESVLSRVHDQLRPRISPENIVIVGLRDVTQEESARLKASRIRVFTIVDIDARGIRDVMKEAVQVANAGTRGYHVFYAPHATDLRSWPMGIGGLTVRETHQAMEAIAANGKLISFSTSGLAGSLPPGVASTTLHFMLSAMGKQILH
jgi:arginase family enzyme